MTDEDDTVQVGYKKPPKSSRFTAGHSGNPKGRPKNPKGHKIIVREVAEEVHKVQGPDGKKRSMTTQELVLRFIRDSALNGIRLATQEYRKLVPRYEPDHSNEPWRVLIIPETAHMTDEEIERQIEEQQRVYRDPNYKGGT